MRLVQTDLEGVQLERKTLELRRKVGERFEASNPLIRKLMTVEAARFVWLSIRQQTFIAEEMFLKHQVPYLHHLRSSFLQFQRNVLSLQNLNARQAYELGKAHGLHFKAGFLFALLGGEGWEGICVDLWWFKQLGFSEQLRKARSHSREVDKIKREVYRLCGNSVDVSWLRWFAMTPTLTYFHLPVQRYLLRIQPDDVIRIVMPELESKLRNLRLD